MNKKPRFILILLYIVFLIGLTEGLARLVFSNSKLSDRLWAYEDLSWRRSWINRHNNTGMEVYYTFDIYDSTKGWISKPNIKDMQVFDNKVLNTNSKGFRGKTEYSYNKDQDKIRILIVGDSHTFGEEVSDNETYPYYLQEIIPNAEVMNLGMHGYGHDQMLIFLKEEGIKYNPDIIILGYIHYNMRRNMLNFRDYAKPKFELNRKEELRLTATPVPPPEETLKWDWTRPRIVDIFSIIHYKLRLRSGLYSKEKDKLTTAILNEIITLADSIHAIPIFVYLPTTPEITVGDLLTPGEKYLSSVCEANDIVRYISTRPYFIEQLNKNVIFKEKGHWGSVGNLAIAEAIKHYLVDGDYVTLRDNLEQSDISEPNKMLQEVPLTALHHSP
ncbi:MAG: hypothetical protein V3W20_11055 [Candidatus Neomarinimicrobiota bacterium]